MTLHLVSTIEEHPPTDPDAGRLGRHLHFDRASADHRISERLDPTAALKSKTWTRRSPAWDQGQIGKCTVMGGKGVLLTAPTRQSLSTKQVASLADTNALYTRETQNDPYPGSWPPNDTGSSVLAFMQMAKAMGLVAAYRWAFSFDECLRTLSQLGPVEVGVNWYDSFDSPAADGTVSLSPRASIRGGHAFEILGIDVRQKLVVADNSWGTGWGLKGRFLIPWAVLERLLAEQGEVVVPQAA